LPRGCARTMPRASRADVGPIAMPHGGPCQPLKLFTRQMDAGVDSYGSGALCCLSDVRAASRTWKKPTLRQKVALEPDGLCCRRGRPSPSMSCDTIGSSSLACDRPGAECGDKIVIGKPLRCASSSALVYSCWPVVPPDAGQAMLTPSQFQLWCLVFAWPPDTCSSDGGALLSASASWAGACHHVSALCLGNDG